MDKMRFIKVNNNIQQVWHLREILMKKNRKLKKLMNGKKKLNVKFKNNKKQNFKNY